MINAAGPYSGVVAQMVGLDIPFYPERHQILVTEPVDPVLGPMVMSFPGDSTVSKRLTEVSLWVWGGSQREAGGFLSPAHGNS